MINHILYQSISQPTFQSTTTTSPPEAAILRCPKVGKNGSRLKGTSFAKSFNLDSFGHLAAPRNSNSYYWSERANVGSPTLTGNGCDLTSKGNQAPASRTTIKRNQMEKVWKGAPFTLHVTVGGVFYVMQQHAPVHTRLLFDRNRMQERPVYIKTEAEVIWKQSTLESIFRDWKGCFEAKRQLEHGRSVLFPPWKHCWNGSANL